MKACLRTFDVTGKKFRVPLRFVTNDLLEGRKNVIVRFNQLWSLVHQDCKNHKNIIGIWTTKRKAELDIGEKPAEVSQVSPEGFACWMLSEIESEGVSDSLNVRRVRLSNSI